MGEELNEAPRRRVSVYTWGAGIGAILIPPAGLIAFVDLTRHDSKILDDYISIAVAVLLFLGLALLNLRPLQIPARLVLSLAYLPAMYMILFGIAWIYGSPH